MAVPSRGGPAGAAGLIARPGRGPAARGSARPTLGGVDSPLVVRTPTEVATMREAGRVVAAMLAAVREAVAPGVRLRELDEIARTVLAENGATSPFLGYHPSWAPVPFNGVLCLSTNEVVVHGRPTGARLREGDLLSVDAGATLDGWNGDAAITVPVGAATEADDALVAATEEALAAGISAAVPGATLLDVATAVDAVARRHGYSHLPDHGGHAVGPTARGYAKGDEVLGYVRKDYVGDGTYAEQVVAWPRHLAHKPAGVPFESAAALPLVGLTALQSVETARVDEGDTVLVHAAAGGVGHVAVQIAVARGARVIGTASKANHEFVRSLGAEPVAYGDGLVDAVRSLAPDGVDAALDYVGGEAIDASAALVKDPARTTSNVDPKAIRAIGGSYCFVYPDPQQLADLVAMVEAGTLTVEVARTYPLDQAADAHREQEGNHVRGKLVLTL